MWRQRQHQIQPLVWLPIQAANNLYYLIDGLPGRPTANSHRPICSCSLQLLCSRQSVSAFRRAGSQCYETTARQAGQHVSALSNLPACQGQTGLASNSNFGIKIELENKRPDAREYLRVSAEHLHPMHLLQFYFDSLSCRRRRRRSRHRIDSRNLVARNGINN